jgi:ABC-type Na+ efflux pump permease subunit
MLSTAIDTGAGEKERGTLESLLLLPVPRSHLVIAKFCAIATVGIVAGTIAIISLMPAATRKHGSHVSQGMIVLVVPIILAHAAKHEARQRLSLGAHHQHCAGGKDILKGTLAMADFAVVFGATLLAALTLLAFCTRWCERCTPQLM